jgi:hypothetical protein
MTSQETRVVAAWKAAAADLGFRFTAPFLVTAPDGRQHEHLGLVHLFGRPAGALISVLGEPSEKLPHPAGESYYRSVLGSNYDQYDRQMFVDTLNDWQFFGSNTERPSWYSGASWS